MLLENEQGLSKDAVESKLLSAGDVWGLLPLVQVTEGKWEEHLCLWCLLQKHQVFEKDKF